MVFTQILLARNVPCFAVFLDLDFSVSRICYSHPGLARARIQANIMRDEDVEGFTDAAPSCSEHQP